MCKPWKINGAPKHRERPISELRKFPSGHLRERY